MISIRSRYLLASPLSHASLDAVRGVAAILVCLHHWRNLLFEDYANGAGGGRLKQFTYLLTGAGHQAVIVFFVLSGFLISGTVLGSVGSGHWCWGRYFFQRATRLWIVLIPALILGGLWDAAGSSLGLAPRLYAGLVQNHMATGVQNSLNFQVLMGNVLFLQTILVRTFGSNGPLWSLANEAWYYILFPLAICAVDSRASRRKTLLYGASFVAIVVFVGPAIALYFPVWLIGAGLHFVRRVHGTNGTRLMYTALYIVAFFTSAAVSHSKFAANQGNRLGLANDYTLAIATCAFLNTLSASGQRTLQLAARTARATARFSYTLYLVHAPLLIFLASLWIRDRRVHMTPATLRVGVIMLAITIVYAWAVASVTEFHTDNIRNWIEKKWDLLRVPTKRFPRNRRTVPPDRVNCRS